MKYADRNGERWEESSFQDQLLEKLYNSFAGRVLVKILVCPVISKIGGRVLSSKASKLLIPGFIKRHDLDSGQWEKQEFDSYNDFFTRKYTESQRLITEKKELFISPCDGKLTVYPITKDGNFMIKHTSYTVPSLLKNRKLAKKFVEGYALVFRLTVDDYHRYCYVDDGVKSSNYRIPGVFHTVNPIANDLEPIYKENTREYCVQHSENFGTLLLMEVGALMVGKIRNYHGARRVRKGQEKGRFEFGGSTIIILTQQGSVSVDRDILKNSRQGYETIVKMGEVIGKR
ncbi:MAG: phosphatidylserine decarboxylase [Clostridia bacterium]|nr:phosphatidylserine decarboxylase [Clostridia bacterium]NCC42579.1 phosphatidylserine decarboxylase [Clostridia bacterium]